MPGHEAVEGQGRLDAGDLGLVEGPHEPPDGSRSILGVDHDLGDQVVVLGRDAVTGLDGRVDPDAWAGRHGPAADATRGRGKVAGRVLGRDPDLDGVARRLGRACRCGHGLGGERAPGGEPELFADEVEAGDQLRHAMLHLEPGVHLQEVERAVRRAQELGRGGVPEAGGVRDPDRHGIELAAFVNGQARRGRLLHELLVATLDRAVTLPDRDDRAAGVAQQLDLDMPGGDDLALQVDRAIAEGRGRLLRAGRQGCR